MLTLETIHQIHERLGTQHSLPEYLEALRAIGVDHYDTFLEDGHSEYYQGTTKLVSKPVYDPITVAPVSDQDALIGYLNLHQAGKIDYLEMSRGLANSGIARWRFDTADMTISYVDHEGRVVLLEKIS